jgi:hypothetical protein
MTRDISHDLYESLACSDCAKISIYSAKLCPPFCIIFKAMIWNWNLILCRLCTIRAREVELSFVRVATVRKRWKRVPIQISEHFINSISNILIKRCGRPEIMRLLSSVDFFSLNQRIYDRVEVVKKETPFRDRFSMTILLREPTGAMISFFKNSFGNSSIDWISFWFENVKFSPFSFGERESLRRTGIQDGELTSGKIHYVFQEITRKDGRVWQWHTKPQFKQILLACVSRPVTMENAY